MPRKKAVPEPPPPPAQEYHPALQVWRDPKSGKLQIKLPKPRAKWHGAFASLSDATKAASEEGMETPHYIIFVAEKTV
jgi:hypothetical protein